MGLGSDRVGRIRRFLKSRGLSQIGLGDARNLVGPVGCGQEDVKSYGSGRVGVWSGGCQIVRVGSGRVGSGRVGSGRVKLTRPDRRGVARPVNSLGYLINTQESIRTSSNTGSGGGGSSVFFQTSNVTPSSAGPSSSGSSPSFSPLSS